LLFMRVVTAFIIFICIIAVTNAFAQTVSFTETNASLDVIIKKIEKQTDYRFAGTTELIKEADKISVNFKNTPLNQALKQLFLNQPLDYTLYGNLIIIKERDKDINLVEKQPELYQINGTVSDGNGSPLPGATVFIANSQKAMPTNEAGKFDLEGLEPGTYELVVKMLGFNIYDKPVTIQKKPVDLSIKLQENPIALKTVDIVALSKSDREKYLKLFIKLFIGESENADKCKLINPDAVNLNYDKTANVLEASSDGFLIIENKSLGYEVHYLLKEFKMDMPNQLLSYDGSLYFKPLTGSKSKYEKWQKNRLLTYEGSMWHFFKSAFNNTLVKDGFLIYRVPDADAAEKIKNTDFKNIAPLDNTDSLFIKVNRSFKMFNLEPLKTDSSELYIIYTKRDEPAKYIESSGIQIPFKNKTVQYEKNRAEQLPFKIPADKRQITIIHPVLDSILFDKNGNISPEKGILPRGYWSWARIGDLFPVDFSSPSVYQQNIPLVKEIKAFVSDIDTIRTRFPVEKLYVQLDKPYYTSGDTLHFKSYLLDADFLTPSKQSGLLYVELDNSYNSVVKRIMVPLASGISWGDIALDSKDIPAGNYTFRAYTNWMRNFKEEYIFKKDIYITSADNKATLIKTAFDLINQGDKDKIQAGIKFNDLDGKPFSSKDMQLHIRAGSKTLQAAKLTTDINGNATVNFDLPEKTGVRNLFLQVQRTNKDPDTTTLNIPVTINRAENTDLQFMPEGGNLVNEIPARIGFKAISEDGKGVAVAGKIYNSSQQEVAAFRSIHNGMGEFEFTPLSGEVYTAKLTLPENISKTYTLPSVNSIGTMLRIDQGRDSLELTLRVSPELISAPANYYLIGQARGLVCYASLISFNQPVIKRAIAKKLFPTGITRFTLLSADKLPLNERIVYIDNDDNLQVTISSEKNGFSQRDSIALALQVTDKDGKPIQGTFSAVVTDDSQVKIDSTENNMLTSMLLTYDLKGNVEEPGWYFDVDDNRANASDRVTALDDLLLTQGWTGYDWKTILDPKMRQIQYHAEPEFVVRGRVINAMNRPVPNASVSLISTRPLLKIDTVTDREGRFVFKDLFMVDTAEFSLKARNRNNNLTIQMEDEFIPPVFSSSDPVMPWYINTDRTLLNYTKSKITLLKANPDYNKNGQLQEVIVKDKKIIKNSKNLNGLGEADQILDENDISKAGNITLGQLLQKYIKGFGPNNLFALRSNNINCTLFEKQARIIINGIDITSMDPNQSSTFVKDCLDYYSAQDIAGIEVMYNEKHTLAYKVRYDGGKASTGNPAFIVVTTLSGRNLFTKPVPGAYLYKPLPFTLPKQFYRPRYTVKNNTAAIGTDLRSTIHWEPNMVTDTAGKATISFFSADRPANYTVVIQGTDLNGNIGYKRQKLYWKAKPVAAK